MDQESIIYKAQITYSHPKTGQFNGSIHTNKSKHTLENEMKFMTDKMNTIYKDSEWHYKYRMWSVSM